MTVVIRPTCGIGIETKVSGGVRAGILKACHEGLRK
jgi:hypothetical protein